VDVHRISGPAGVENANLGEGSRAESGISYETAWHMRGRIRSEKAHQKDIRQRLIGVIGVEEPFFVVFPQRAVGLPAFLSRYF
jgi:hypothetical protein